MTNWRLEAADNLDLPPDFKTKLTVGNDLPEVPRCVKLNNYWCIKRAGWAGEIAAAEMSRVFTHREIIRTRYCALGDLNCIKEETVSGRL